jgi:hypothetical protein
MCCICDLSSFSGSIMSHPLVAQNLCGVTLVRNAHSGFACYTLANASVADIEPG